MMSLLEEFCQFCMVLWKILCLSLVDVAKSLVPCGWLPKKSVRGKIVLITGSGNGLGRSMACEFAKLGARLVLWDIDARMNAETKQMVDQIGNYEAAAYQVDLSKREQIYATAERVHEDMGAWPDILVNNAGIAYAKEIVELPDNVIEAIMAVNCTALFYTAKAFLPGMVARREGHIVNIASMAGIVGVNRLAAYCVSKHGAIGFSDTLRAEIDELQVPIRVTTVCPYYVNTNMATGIQTFSRLLPILEPAYVVERIMEAVLTEAEALYLPWASNLLVAFKGLFSPRVGLVVLKYLGVNRGTETWQEQKTTATATMQNGNAN